jgi:hypothetical protein
MNKDAMSMGVHTSPQEPFPNMDICPEFGLLHHMVALFLII